MDTLERTTLTQEYPSTPKPALWLGLAPFLPWPLLYLLVSATSTITSLDPESYLFKRIFGWVLLGVMLLPGVAVLVVGWVKGFPTWTLPYWVFALMAVVYPPAAEPLRYYLLSESLGWNPPRWWTAIPFLIVVALMLAVRPSLSPLRRLVNRTRRDWTLLSFTLYAASPILLQMAFAGMFYQQLFQACMNVILALGAMYYLRGPSVRRRMAALLAASLVTWMWSAFFLDNAWRHPVLPSMQYPVEGISPLMVTLGMGAGLCVLVGLPWLMQKS